MWKDPSKGIFDEIMGRRRDDTMKGTRPLDANEIRLVLAKIRLQTERTIYDLYKPQRREPS